MDSTLDPADWDPTDPSFRRDPYPWYAALREHAPVHRRDDVGYVLSRFEDIDGLLRSDAFAVATPSPWREVVAEHASPALARLGEHSLLFLDPPGHSRVRSLVARAFGPKRIAALRPEVEQVCAAILDDLAGLAGGEEVDLLGAVAEPIPILTIARLLGVPDVDWSALHAWSVAITAFDELPIDFLALPGANAAATEFADYCDALIEERRRDLGEDLVSALISAEEDGERLSHDELVSMIMLLLIAGHDTTKSLISSGLWVLLRHPEQADRLRADDALAASAIEELLRFESPLHVASGGGRWPRQPIEIHGQVLEPGTPVRLLLGSANHDPAAFVDPDRLDLGRSARPHLAFGRGIHHCLGAALGRLEGQVVIPAVLRAFPDLALVDMTPEWRPSFVVRQLSRLVVATT